MVQFITVTAENFKETLKKAVEENEAVFVFFLGNDDPETGKSWCPDTEVSQPLVHAAFAGTNAVIVEVPVGMKDEWKSPDNIYRAEPTSVTAVPTLVRWTKEGPQERLVETEMADLGDVTAFVNRFISA